MNDEARYPALVPPAPRWSTMADALPLLALVAAGLWLLLPQPPEAVEPLELKYVSADSAAALERIFQSHDYQWLPQGPVPTLAVRGFPTDLGEARIPVKKSLFFRSLLPLVLAENQAIRRERAELQALFADGELEPESSEWRRAKAIAGRYKVKGDLNASAVRDELLRLVGEIPPSLALAQAANESAWGTSRFAREGNNLFGQWTWDADEGMLPQQRAADADHYVRRFRSLRESVSAYMHNLNTHPAYAELRDHRRRLRRSGTSVTGMRLAGGLSAYSERGMDYVNEVREMIAYNRLRRINDAQLALAD